MVRLLNHGKRFENRMKASWNNSELNIERIRVSDKIGAERICDEMIIGDLVLYCEHKSTKSHKFKFNMVKPHQYRAMTSVMGKRRNTVPVVCVEFCSDALGDKLCVIEMSDLLDAIRHGTRSASYPELLKLGGVGVPFDELGTYDVSTIYNILKRRHLR